MDGDAGLTHQLSVDTDDEGEEYMSTVLSSNPLLMRKWLGSVLGIYMTLYIPHSMGI